MIINMKNAMKSFCFILMFLGSLVSFAQQRTISGSIKSSGGDPLPGSTVVVKGTMNGTITDFDGKYQIRANQGDTLIVTFIGFEDASQVVGSESQSFVVGLFPFAGRDARAPLTFSTHHEGSR